MNKKIHLIMPMGGAGSRFSNNGFELPKPLININGYPFLYWSTRSITKFVDVQDITFVVLKDHIANFNIDKVIIKYFPKARIVVLDKVLNGAVLTCLKGCENISDDKPMIFNDCDHLFKSSEFNNFCLKENFEDIDGALLTFLSSENKYSYLELDSNGNVIKTVEKKAISNKAICGAYYFKNKETFVRNALEYLEACEYNEYYISGVYNIMARNNLIIKNFNVDYHLPFGTPEEYNSAKNSDKFEDLL